MTGSGPRAPGAPALVEVGVWDLPTRLFHWTLVLLVAVNLYTGNVGGIAEMRWHMLSGYAILALVLFRLAWGVIGSRQSRFASFVRGPRAVLAYLRDLIAGRHRAAIGHNPLGAVSVVALLVSLLVQAATGLFADDEILTRGPLARRVSEETSQVLTAVHEINASVLYVLIAVHLAAVLYYLVVQRENLVRPMLTGRKRLPAGTAAAERFASPVIAALVLAAAAAAVWGLVR